MTVLTYSLKKDGSKVLSKNFKIKEFKCKDGSDEILIDADFVINKLQKIRDHFGKPITINSAYRTASWNTKVGGAKNSYHMKGMAFDIKIAGVTPTDIAKYAEEIGVLGIIVYPTFTHVDSRTNKYFSKDAGKTSCTSFKDDFYVWYTVKKGDSLSKIAKNYLFVTWQDIAKLNGIKFPYILKVGQKIRIK